MNQRHAGTPQPQPNRMAAPPGGIVRQPFNYAAPAHGYCCPCPSMSPDGRCAGMQQYPRMMGPPGAPYVPAGPASLQQILMEMLSLQQMMFDLQGRMCQLQGQIVHIQQAQAASGAVYPPNHQLPPAATHAFLPSEEQPTVSSVGAASELDPPQTASEIVQAVTASGTVPPNHQRLPPAATHASLPSQGQTKVNSDGVSSALDPKQTASETVQAVEASPNHPELPPASTHASIPSKGQPKVSSEGAASAFDLPKAASETVQTVTASCAVSPKNRQLPPAATHASLPSEEQPTVSSVGAASTIALSQNASETVQSVAALDAAYPQNHPDMPPAVTKPAMPSQGQHKVQANQTTDSQDCEPKPKKRKMNEILEVEEESVQGASTWSAPLLPAPAKSPSLLLSKDIKSIENENEAKKAVVKGLQDLPPEIIGKIMSYCSTKDKKEMRRVSKWCYNVVSTASKELKFLFTYIYTIKEIEENNYGKISKLLRKAMERVPEIMLHLHFSPYRDNSKQLEEMLTTYEKKIYSLKFQLDINPKILLHPHLNLTNIQRLDIDDVDEGLHEYICEAILARYGDKLEHLGVRFLEIPNNTVLQVPHLSKLKSLALGIEDNILVNTFLNSVNKENITHLSLWRIYQDREQLDNFIFPNLQYLELSGESGESALALIKCHKDTITKLKVNNVYFRPFFCDIWDIKIPNLKNLTLFDTSDGVALSLIKCNKDTITKLKLGLTFLDLRKRGIGDVKIPNLQCLELRTPGNVALFFIKNNKDTLCELRLNYEFNFEKNYLPVVEMPRLKRLYLAHFKATHKLNLMKGIGRNIEELWSYDIRKKTYIRKPRKELNNLKKKALAS